MHVFIETNSGPDTALRMVEQVDRVPAITQYVIWHIDFQSLLIR